MTSNKAKYYLILILACFLWGTTPLCGRYLRDCMSPLLITAARFYLVTLILFALIYLKDGKKGFKISFKDAKILFLMGFMGIFLHNSLFFEAVRTIPASNAALIESIGPAITSVLAFFFIGEKLSKLGWLGIFISAIGAIFIVCKGNLEALLDFQINFGEILVIISESTWSFYIILSWKLSNKLNSLAITAWTGLTGAILCTLTGLVLGELTVYKITTTDVIYFLVLSIMAGVVSFVSWNYAIVKVGASKGSSLVYLIPLFGVMFGITILDEKFVVQEAIGGAIIILGLIFAMKAKLSSK